MWKSNENASSYFGQLLACVPRVFADVLDPVSSLRVSLKNALYHVSGLFTNRFGNAELSIKNLFIKVGSIRIFKRQVATNQSEKNYAAWPNVYLATMVSLTSNHFRCSVTRGATSSFQCLTIFESVWKTKIYNFDILVVIKQ